MFLEGTMDSIITYYVHAFCVFCNFARFLYDPGQMTMRTVFPRYYTLFR